MASHFFDYARQQLVSGAIDLSSDDIRVALLSTNTTADTEYDAEAIDDITTLDEFDGANYERKALDSEAVNIDAVNHRAEFDATDVTWSALGAGTRAVQGVLVFKFVADDTDSIPIAWIEKSATPDGNDFQIVWNAEGILQF